jgi:hypothetical protein
MRDVAEPYPGYDVLAKRHTPSWNEKTRQVIDARLALPRTPRFLTEAEYATVEAIAARIVPQPRHRPPIPVAALVDEKLHIGQRDGYRPAHMPREEDAWRRGLAALDAEAEMAYGVPFRDLTPMQQDALLERMEKGELHHPSWGRMSPKSFFSHRMAHDIVFAYYAHPIAWSEIGFGGPASPRGYVRTRFDERDPWEAAEVKNGDVETARKLNRRVG